jgi:hypothetical protein
MGMTRFGSSWRRVRRRPSAVARVAVALGQIVG